MTAFSNASDVLTRAVHAGAFPAAVAEVGTAGDVLWRQAFGRLSWDSASLMTQPNTIFDLASLTKVIATTSLVMRLIEDGRLALGARVTDLIRTWAGRDRDIVTIRHLLSHSAGLTAWLPLYRDHHGREEFEHAICTLPLEYEPGSRSLYSDLGFMLLGFVVEDVGGRTLAEQFDDLVAGWSLASPELSFGVPADQRQLAAPTELDPWRGRMLQGEVHDENAWALGGAAGHAGIFGTVGAVGAFARLVLNSLDGAGNLLASAKLMRQFVTRIGVPDTSRALGWDTMLPTSSCGTRMSSSAFGHTGFTGTSVWMDPVRSIYAVLLTNRVHPTRANDAIVKVRPAFHDAVMGAL